MRESRARPPMTASRGVADDYTLEPTFHDGGPPAVHCAATDSRAVNRLRLGRPGHEMRGSIPAPAPREGDRTRAPQPPSPSTERPSTANVTPTGHRPALDQTNGLGSSTRL